MPQESLQEGSRVLIIHHSVHCIVYNVQSTVHGARYTMYNVQCVGPS